jgi:hypothetical protein
MYSWNDEKIKRHFERTLRWAKEDRYNFTDEELKSPYLDKLSHQTRSGRIMRMVTLAYHLGKLKGIQEMDEGKTPISLS